MLELPAGRGRGQPKHPARKFRDQFPDIHEYYCAVALLMLEAQREARRQNREGETQAIFCERFRELAGENDYDVGWRSNTFCRWFDVRFLKENSTRPKIRSYFLLTARGRRRQL